LGLGDVGDYILPTYEIIVDLGARKRQEEVPKCVG